MSALILLAAASAPADLTICADRPSKANGVCTVPAGHWQLEVSGVDWTRTSADGVRSDVFSAGSTFVKMGLDSQSDIEAGFTPFIRTSSRGNGVHENASGVGDLVLRYKRRLNGADSATQIGLIPFVKIPTAGHDLGNGKVEGGMVLPVSLATKTGISLTLGPEIDLLGDNDGEGYHAALANLVNVGFSATSQLSLSAELWNSLNFDPRGTVRQWSVDASAAYLASNRFQLDGGANFGLNRASPDVELYAGVSMLY